MDVIIGAYDLNNSSQGERIAAQKIYRHLSYSPSNLLNDIAIVELAQTSSLPAITLAGPATRTSLPALTPLTVAGWGLPCNQNRHNLLRYYKKWMLTWFRNRFAK